MPAKVANIYTYVLSRLDRSGGPKACWPWLRSLNRPKTGYGRVKHDGKNLLIHRIVWEHDRKRAVPVGKRVLHRAVNLSCEEHGSARLTNDQARRIFLDTRPRIVIHRETGISISQLQRIFDRKNWRPITENLTTPLRMDGRSHPGVAQAFAKMAAEEERS